MYQGCSHGQKVSCVFGNTIGILSGDSEIFYFRRKIKTFAGLSGGGPLFCHLTRRPDSVTRHYPGSGLGYTRSARSTQPLGLAASLRYARHARSHRVARSTRPMGWVALLATLARFASLRSPRSLVPPRSATTASLAPPTPGGRGWGVQGATSRPYMGW